MKSKSTIKLPFVGDRSVQFVSEHEFIADKTADKVGKSRAKDVAKKQIQEFNKKSKKTKKNKAVFFRQVPSDVNDLAICSDEGRYNRTLAYRTALSLFSALADDERRIFLDKFTKKSVGVSAHGHALTRKNLILNFIDSDIEFLANCNIYDENEEPIYQYATVCRAALNWLSIQPKEFIYAEIKLRNV